jgi:hypothetical protein
VQRAWEAPRLLRPRLPQAPSHTPSPEEQLVALLGVRCCPLLQAHASCAEESMLLVAMHYIDAGGQGSGRPSSSSMPSTATGTPHSGA